MTDATSQARSSDAPVGPDESWQVRAAASSEHEATATLRVLVVSHYLWPEEFRINQVLADLQARGARVVALTGQPNYPGGTVFEGYSAWSFGYGGNAPGFEIVRVPVIPRGRGGGIRLALNYLSSLAAGILLGPWLLRGREFDVVLVYGTSPVIQGFIANWLGRLKRAPVVHWVQDLWPHALAATGHVRSPMLLRMIDWTVRRMYRRSVLVLGQSHAFVRFLRDQASPAPVRYFPNPGDSSEPTAMTAENGGPPGFTIVFAGNLGRAQALETVIAAADLLSDLPDVSILLYGSGVMTDWIAAETKRLGLSNVILAGRVSPDEIRRVYAQASALLLTLADDPILSRTVPSKLQSYLAAGRPIVAGVSGEAADIVLQSKSGLACDAGNAQALAEVIRRLRALSPEERAAMGVAGRRYFENHYHPDLLTEQLLAGLSQVAAGVHPDAFDVGVTA